MKSRVETKLPGRGGSLSVRSSYLLLSETGGRGKKDPPTLVPGKNDTKSGGMGPFTASNIFASINY